MTTPDVGTKPAQSLGYDDTPLIPGSIWHVHDGKRPQPRIVRSDTAGIACGPPSDAVVLFDGRDLSQWEKEDGSPAAWKVESGYMEVVPRTGHIRTRQAIGDCQLHLEWAAPTEIAGPGQKRGNSGIFLMELYEIQVLDCYENTTYADGTVGAIYGQCPPLVNPSRPPGQWQTYDIVWVGPRFEGAQLLSPARITVFLNGVLLHHDRELISPTSHKKVCTYEPHEPALPLLLQDHRNPVRFRNIWYRPLTSYDA